jgi:hypothetical protein
LPLYFPSFVNHFGRIMTRRSLSLFVLVLTGWRVMCCSLSAAATNPAPDFKEVYELLRANLPEATDVMLNRAAVAGLVAQFPGQVALVSGPADGAAGSQNGSALGQAAVIENNVAYLRVNRVAGNLAGDLGAAGRALVSTNQLAGAVLDLRFAGGDDLGAAQAAAKLLADKTSARPFAGPLVVLVNGGTSGTAEALAVALRQAGAALILGSPTAGAAMSFKQFVLNDGERLLIAATPVKAEGKAIPSDGLKPDVAVAASRGDELIFFKNPYGITSLDTAGSAATTNGFLPFIDHTSEADLVRQRRKDGKAISVSPPPGTVRRPVRKNGDDPDNDDDSAPSPAAEPPKPVLRDPVLARAVDLVKGLAVMQVSHP